MNFYFLCWSDSKSGAVAYPPSDAPLPFLITDKVITGEIPFEFTLKYVEEGDNDIVVHENVPVGEDLWVDYMPNEYAWPFMSLEMKQAMEGKLTGVEGIIWKEVKVTDGLIKKDYYIPVFTKILDVLDIEKTLFVKGTDHVIKPAFSKKKLTNLNMFHMPGKFCKITPGLYVNDIIKKEIQKLKLSGVSFEKINHNLCD